MSKMLVYMHITIFIAEWIELTVKYSSIKMWLTIAYFFREAQKKSYISKWAI